MRTTLTRQLRRFDTHGSVTEVIAKDFDISRQVNHDLGTFTRNYIIAYHRTKRRIKPLPQAPSREHRRSKSRRSK